MYKKIVWALVGIIIIGGAGCSNKEVETVQPAASTDVKPVTRSATYPKTLEELEERLADTDLLDLYVARSAKGVFAAGMLADFRDMKNVVAKEDARRMYAQGALKANDADDPAIILVNCGDVLVQPFMDSDFTPGHIALTMYTTDTDLSKTNKIYISPGQDKNEAGDKWPMLYGPYAVSAAGALDSFADLDCIQL